jgi:arylsulfatase
MHSRSLRPLDGLVSSDQWRGGFPAETDRLGQPCPRCLPEAGYQTALVGRNMHQAADDQQLGYHTVVLGSTYVSNDDYASAVMQAVPDIQDFRKWVEGLGLSYNHWQAMPWPLSDDLHPTTWVIQQSRRVLAEASKDRPLLLTTSFYAPHPPLFPRRMTSKPA